MEGRGVWGICRELYFFFLCMFGFLVSGLFFCWFLFVKFVKFGLGLVFVWLLLYLTCSTQAVNDNQPGEIGFRRSMYVLMNFRGAIAVTLNAK